MKNRACRVYLITPPQIADCHAFANGPLRDALDGGDVACVQLRIKSAEDDDVLKAAEILGPVVQGRDAAFLVNDRPDLARRVGADGVHVGQSDASYDEARRIVGPDAVIGVTCHDSLHLAMVAAEAGADYVAFGAFFPTTTKEAPTRAGLDLLEGWAAMAETPSVAIGGVSAENCGALVAAGADFLAVSSYVWRHPIGPGAAVAALNHAIEEASR